MISNHSQIEPMAKEPIEPLKNLNSVTTPIPKSRKGEDREVSLNQQSRVKFPSSSIFLKKDNRIPKLSAVSSVTPCTKIAEKRNESEIPLR